MNILKEKIKTILRDSLDAEERNFLDLPAHPAIVGVEKAADEIVTLFDSTESFESLPDEVLSNALSILLGNYKLRWSVRYRAEEMRSILSGNTEYAVSFKKYLAVIDYLRLQAAEK